MTMTQKVAHQSPAGVATMAPTHRCKECGALWRFWRGEECGQASDSWNLRSATCGKCCDMAPMKEQIEPMTLEMMADAMPLPVRDDFTLRQFQTNLPWTIRYSTDFRATPMAHKDFAHTLHHVAKAAGKLHGLADDMDHSRELADDPTLREQYGKYVADLVVCALRLANVFPGGVLDLQQAVHDRIEGKNGVKL